MIRSTAIAICAVVTLCAADAALAQPSPEERQALRAACANDYMTLCPDAKTGPDRHQCMMANQDKVSAGCKAAIADMRAKRRMQMQEVAPAPTPGSDAPGF